MYEVKPKTSILFIIITTMMGVLTLLPSDIYLPALPMMQYDFATSASAVGLTLSAFFLGAGISQVLAGPFVDSMDNKKLSIISLVIFTTVSLLSVFANSITVLICYRFVQAFSAGLIVVVSRAVVIKQCSKEDVTRVFLIMSPIIAISPGVAPIIGGYAAKYFGWRASFVFVTLFGLLLIYLCSKYISKTFPKNHSSMHPKYIVQTYGKLLGNLKFTTYLLLRTGIDASYFAYITASPFLFYHLGYVASQIGNFYLLIAISYIVMTYVCKKYIDKISTDRLIIIGQCISITGILLLGIIGCMGIQSATLIIIAAAIMTAGYGFAGPLSWSEAMAQFPDDAGSASSLIGFLPLAASALVAAFINSITHNSLIILVFILFVILFIPTLIHYILVYKLRK